MHLFSQLFAWLVAAAWTARSLDAVRGLPTVPDLVEPAFDRLPEGLPWVTVIVPGRNEAASVLACLRSLLAQDYANVRVVAVDDRSEDETGRLMDSLACPGLEVLHIAELPVGWLGKTHAMALAASHALLDQKPDFLLFTDADILFRPDAIRRALVHAVAARADHLVVAPTTLIRRWDEAALLSFFQLFGFWAARPWKVPDPECVRDAIGIGAFNMVRTSVYQQLGGFAALKMEIVEDLGLARRVKLAGFRQRFAFGLTLVSVHWASGARGIIQVMTKNMFAAVGYRIWLLMLACLWLCFFCIMPFVNLWNRSLAIPSAVTMAAVFLAYRLLSSRSGLSVWNAFLAPFAAALFLYALLRSMAVTLYQGGVLWRGTFYPLRELRKHTLPLFPARKAKRF